MTNGEPKREEDALPPTRVPDDVFDEIERLRKAPVRFSCLGIGCGGCVALLIGTLVVILLLRRFL